MRCICPLFLDVILLLEHDLLDRFDFVFRKLLDSELADAFKFPSRGQIEDCDPL